MEITDRVLPDTVRELVLDHVDSFEKLEALMLLQGGRGTWTARSVSVRLRLPLSVAVSALDELRGSHLIEAHGADERVFWYAPGTLELAQAVDDLAAVFEQNRVALIKFMATSAIARVRSSAIRAFADALGARGSDDTGEGKD